MTTAATLPSMPPRPPPADATPSPLGARLRDAREARGYGVRELAHAASTEARAVTHTTLSLVEAGRQLSLDALVAVQLARALGVEVEWLVTGEGRRERTRR